jgi:hypothetical protein
MWFSRLGSKLDERVGAMAEKTTRSVTRRHVLRTALVGGATGVGALSIGVDPALASCASNCGPTRRCSGCRRHKCPLGWSLCKGSSTNGCFNDQGYRCEWPAGYWVACNNLGHGYGARLCLDCINGNCATWCTCLTHCHCCGCTSAADVVAEQKRIQQELLTN